MPDDEDRFIVTKRRTYRVPGDVQGTPVEEYFSDATLPRSLQGAKVYETEDGPVIAKKLPDDP